MTFIVAAPSHDKAFVRLANIFKCCRFEKIFDDKLIFVFVLVWVR